MKRVALNALLIILCIAGTKMAAAADAVLTPVGVVLHDSPAGPVFADPKGMTLYVFDCDLLPSERPQISRQQAASYYQGCERLVPADIPQGQSRCIKGCVDLWPPVRATEGAKPVGEWTLIPRNDGAPQWAYRGRPLYRYSLELKPGMAFGIGPYWKVATAAWQFPKRVFDDSNGVSRKDNVAVDVKDAPGGFRSRMTDRGEILVDYRGMTLYLEKKPAKRRPCGLVCGGNWKPVIAPAAALPIGTWRIVSRADGSLQWAYKGSPLYVCAFDTRPGDSSCEVDGWEAARL